MLEVELFSLIFEVFGRSDDNKEKKQVSKIEA